MLKHALDYHSKGYSIIPCHGKKSLVKWKPYQQKLPTKEDIHNWWKKWPDANIAVITGELSGINVIDIDSEEGKENINKLLPDKFNTPIVQSPSGFYHLWCKHQQGLNNDAGTVPGVDLRAEGGFIIVPPSKNGNNKSYKWVQGGSDGPFAGLPRRYVKALKTTSIEQPSPTLSFAKPYRDNTLFHIANCMAKGELEKDMASKIMKLLHQHCIVQADKDVFTVNNALEKINSAYQRHQNRNISNEIKHWIKDQQGKFRIRDIFQDLAITTRSHKNRSYQAIHRLVRDNVLEPTKTWAGEYRIVDNDIELMDWVNADTAPVDIILPFKLHDIAELCCGDIMLIQGEMNAGKTALMLNVIKDNVSRWPWEISYFVSEMGPAAVKKRLTNFQDMTIEDWKIKVYERKGNYSDVIDPNGINIIDYMELTENHYLISQYLDEIHDKLQDGVALVCAQKNPGVDTGIGGYRGREKPTIVCNLSQHGASMTLKITKGKYWTHPDKNPNGQEVMFNIINGCRLVQSGDWG